MIRAVAVVVPAANEEERVGACLRSVQRAAAPLAARGVTCVTVLVLDGCTDATAAAALQADPAASLLSTPADRAGCVGVARAAGAEYALRLLSDLEPEAVWIASTDADSTVAPDWLERQLTHADRGAAAVAGIVEVYDWHLRPADVARRYFLYAGALGTGDGHPHVHGANLGISAVAYRQVGGWDAVRTGEDVALWRRLVAAGCACVRAGDVVVSTSARSDSRAPSGFGDLLDALGDGREAPDRPTAGATPPVPH